MTSLKLQSVGPSSAAAVIASSPPIRAVVLATAILNLSAYPCMQLVPVVAREALRVGATLYGSLRAAKGLGSLIGALFIASGRFRGKEVLFVCGTTLMLIGWLGFGLSGVYLVSVLLLLLAGIGESGFTSMQPTIILNAAPAELRGQIMGAVSLAIGASSLGTLLTGQLAERIGASASIVAVTSAGLLALALPSYWLLRPRGHTTEPQTLG
jgi:MFS family permease